ncbi:MAG: glycosyltransferase, partial [Anaerolineae bacterium]|nr:glycosyltransferase [Anaerolineae bacterium]
MAPTLSVVVVSWNVRELLFRALSSIPTPPDTGVSTELIVVDNASHDGSPDMVRRTFPNAHLIANPTNRGFTGANNQGLAAAAGDYVLLLNPDTEVVGNAPQELVAYLQAHPDV